MAEKTLNTRIINKHGTEADWDKATNFIPKKGELIVYDVDNNHTQERIKVGDGSTVAKNLPFTVPTNYIVSGSQTTTSSADGGSNVFTFTKNDGTSAAFTVKNGSKGSTGATGKGAANGTSLTNQNLNDYHTESQCGWYYAGGSNTVTNKPSGVDAFGMWVLRTAQGYYTQELYGSNNNLNKCYMRTYTASSWTAWVEKGATGPKGDKGATGEKGSTGAAGAAATITVGTVTTGAAGSSASVTNAGTSSAAKFNFTIPRGNTGAAGTRGSRWSTGTAITGTSTTATIFSGTGITDALVNDMYLNTSTGYTYRCTVAGAANVAKWVYAGSIKGATGSKGDKGDTGATPAVTATASVDANTGAPSVTVTKSGTTAAPTFAFAFKNLKGAKGSDGVGVVTNLNGATTTGMSIYAPTSPGTSGYYLRSNGVSVEPTWVELSIDDGDIG